MPAPKLTGLARFVVLQVSGPDHPKEDFYISEDIATRHSSFIQQRLADRESNGTESTAPAVIALTYQHHAVYANYDEYRDSVIIFINYAYHGSMESIDGDALNSHQLYDAMMLGAELEARAFQDDLFRLFQNTYNQIPLTSMRAITLAEVLSATPIGANVMYPSLVMDRFLDELVKMDDGELKNLLKKYATKAFMTEAIVHVIKKLKAAAPQVGNGDSTRDSTSPGVKQE